MKPAAAQLFQDIADVFDSNYNLDLGVTTAFRWKLKLHVDPIAKRERFKFACLSIPVRRGDTAAFYD
jgi:hypothetical protein